MARKIIITKLKLETNPETVGILENLSRKCQWLHHYLTEEMEQATEQALTARRTELISLEGASALLTHIREQNKNFENVPPILPINTARYFAQYTLPAPPGKKKEMLWSPWPVKTDWDTDWFPLFYGAPNLAYQIRKGTLHLAVVMGSDARYLTVRIPIQGAHRLKKRKISDMRIVKRDNVFYIEVLSVPSLPKLIIDEAAEAVVELDPQQQYECMVEQGYGHMQFGEVEHPFAPKKDSPGQGARIPAHPLLKDAVQFSGVDPDVNVPSENERQDVREEYVHSYEQQLAPGATPGFHPTPSKGG